MEIFVLKNVCGIQIFVLVTEVDTIPGRVTDNPNSGMQTSDNIQQLSRGRVRIPTERTTNRIKCQLKMVLTAFVAEYILKRLNGTVEKVFGKRQQRTHAKNETNEASSFGGGYKFTIIYAQIGNEILTEGEKVL